jgi:hypothetical protein
VDLDPGLIREFEDFSGLAGGNAFGHPLLHPTFKSFQSSELACSKSAWPAVSITGGDRKLQCDHCKAKVLEPMILHAHRMPCGTLSTGFCGGWGEGDAADGRLESAQ